jgi:thiamine biosynthesis lipoprotein
MGMPIAVEIRGEEERAQELTERVFAWFGEVDQTFSTYKPDSAISRINSGTLGVHDAPTVVQQVLQKCEEAKKYTSGFFDVWHNGRLDPSGYVKGWSVWEAAQLVEQGGGQDYYIDAGGDIQAQGGPWRVGIRNPFARDQIVKVLEVADGAVATSGTYERGRHIYDPHTGKVVKEVASFSVVGPRIDEADVWATAGFAAGIKGAEMVARAGLACYVVGLDGKATFTAGLPVAKDG